MFTNIANIKILSKHTFYPFLLMSPTLIEDYLCISSLESKMLVYFITF